MNYASKILSYLTSETRLSRVLMVAGAPPVEKIDNGVRLVLNTILTPDDIRDTLTTFASHARRTGPSDVGGHGVFAFGMPNLGRFRVHYLTQRGSPLISIQRMPFEVPKLEDILADSGQLPEADALFEQDHGIILLTGPIPTPILQFAYSMLARRNEKTRAVICIVEQGLSFSLRHRNSIIVQIDAGTDALTLEEGIHSALSLSPDLLYVRDCRTREDFAGLICAAEAGALVVASAATFNEKQVLTDIRSRLNEDYDSFCRCLLRGARVTTGRDAKITIHVHMPTTT